MHPIARSALSLAIAALAVSVAHAQSGTTAFAAQFDAVCAGAAPGSALAARCAVVQTSANPNARAIAADFNDLEEIPGAGRGNSRDQWPSENEVKSLITPKLALFASVDHSHSFRSSDVIEAAFDADTTTLTLGADWHPGDRWQLGIALDHTQEHQDFRGSQGRTATHYTGALAIASYSPNDNLALSGYLGRMRGGQDIRRVVSFIDGSTPVAETASPSADRTIGGIALDASLARGAWEWRGSLGLDSGRTTIDAYRETGGSGFDLAVPQRTAKTDRGRLEGALAGTFSESWGVWQPEFRVGLLHEFGNDARTVGARFLQDTLGTVVRFDTGAPDRDWAALGLSSTFTFAHGQSAFVSFGREFGHSTSTASNCAIGWRMEL
jgi:uncharacterized protein YhjY with autotransporter beta-barrel domain